MITLIFPRSPFLIEEDVFPPLGILYLSAWLKQYYVDVQCLDMGLGHTIDMIENDIVGISITSPQRHEAYELAEQLKKRGHITIAGGPHATHMQAECEKYFDHVIAGEGEIPLLHVLHKMGASFNCRGNLHLDMVRAPKHLDNYPFPDRDALPIHNYHYNIDGRPATVLMTTRNCPYACSFCSKLPSGFRMQSAERTLKEIFYVKKKYGFEAFMIFDDVFVANKKRLQKIVDGLKDSGFIFRCFGRSNLLADEEICMLLKEMNVVEVGIGIENGSETVLKKNMKGTTPTMNSVAVRNLKERGIRVKAFLIVGLPGETHETIDETEQWIVDNKPDDVDISIFQPMPGSDIFANPKKWGITFSYDGNQWYKGKPSEYETSVNTGVLTPKDLVAYRDELERKYKVWA